MLRKNSTSSNQKNLCYPHMGDHLKSNAAVLESSGSGENQKNSSFPNVFGGLFVGFNPKGSEMDSMRSPTSPLDFRVFSSLGNPYRSPRASYNEGCHKTWDRPKVGLGIINSLDDETNQSVKVLQSSSSKNVIQNPQMMMIKAQNIGHHIDPIQAPKSLPKDIAIFRKPHTISSNIRKGKSVVFEIGESQFPVEDSKTTIRACSLDSGWCGPQLINIGNRKSRLSSGNFGSGNQTRKLNFPGQPIKGGCFEAGASSGSNSDSHQPVTDPGTGLLGSLSASEIELSEDYTCVRTRGPNPKITHIFGDCILECHSNELSDSSNNNLESTALPQAANNTSSEIISKYPPEDFLSFCYSCKKKLDGKDIYMYRGEKAFCSSDCRSQELLIDEETEKEDSDPSEEISNLNSQDDLFDSGTFIAM